MRADESGLRPDSAAIGAPDHGGDMGRLTRAYDWSGNALGAAEGWPQSLTTTVSLVLGSPLAMIALWGPELIQIYNDAYAVICGAKHPAALGQRTRDCWPEVWAFNAPSYAAVLRGEARLFARQKLTLTRNGEPEDAWFDLGYSPLRDETDAVVGVLVTVVETTGQVLAEARLATLAQRQQRQFQQAPGFICILHGPDHVFEFANEAYLRLVGRGDLVGKTVRAALPDIDGQGFYELLDDVYATGERHVATDMPVRIEPAPGMPPVTKYVEFIYEPVTDEAGHVTGVFTQGHDVTGAHAAREALRDTEARLRDLHADLERVWQISPDLHGVLNLTGVFESANPAWTAMLGWSHDDVLSTSVFAFIHPDDVAASRAVFERLVDGQPLLGFENRYVHKSGGTRWLSWSVVPDGPKYYCSGRDITEAKDRAAELHAVADHLRQAQKMEAIGQLTGGIAHDFNNMLAGVIGGLDTIKRRIAAGRNDEVGRFIELTREAAERAASLTKRLLAFSRRQSLEQAIIDVNALALGMEDMLRRTLGANVVLSLDLQDGVWAIEADASQLENALLNLVINARDSMPGGGALTVATANVMHDPSVRPRLPDLAAGEHVRITVSDEGGGMSETVLQHAFDPFFTTKLIGQGTGLGLSMIYGFVKQSHGHVSIVSGVGQGTAVTLWLPRAAGAVAEAGPVVAIVPPRARTGATVLVVEDEATVRLIVTELLTDFGHEFMEADSADGALPILRSDRRIDLLITDVGLPGMNGRQLAEIARQTRPGLPILFVTGYAEIAEARNEFLGDGMAMLAKPFAADTLIETIEEMLGQHSPNQELVEAVLPT